MSTRREIVVSGRDEGLGSLMDRLRSSSAELGRGLLEESLQNSKNSKDAIKYYEEQIRLIERRNRVYTEGLRQQATQTFETREAAGVGKSAKEDYFRSVKEISREAKEDQLQVQLLKELIETVKITSEQELRKADSTNQSKSDLITRVSQKHGGEAGELTRRMISESTPTESSSLADRLTGAAQQAGGIVGQRSFLGAASSSLGVVGGLAGREGGAGVLGKLGIAGLVIAAVKGLVDMPRTIRAGRETSLSEYAALTGGSVSGLEDAGVGRTSKGSYGPLDLNISREEFTSKWLPQIIKANGTVVGAQSLALRGIELMRGGAVDEGTIMGAARYGRTNGTDATDMAAQIYSVMSKSGTFGKDGKDFSRMSSLLGTLVQLQEGQLTGSSTAGSQANLNLLNRLTSLGGVYKREDISASTVTSLNSGLRSGGTPESQAMKFDILRKLNPDKSYFELQAEMEKGTGSKGYLEAVMKRVKGYGGSEDSQMILFDQLTSGQLKKNDILNMFKGGMDFSNLEEEGTDKGEFAKSMRGRAKRASSTVKTDLDFEAESMGDLASKMGTAIQELIDVFNTKTAAANLIGLGDVPPPAAMAGIMGGANLLYLARQLIKPAKANNAH